ncbi:TPA: hypothetical protein QCU33_005371 [Bacillus cereus]|nr:hypothetical protein [Bacillus cereus]
MDRAKKFSVVIELPKDLGVGSTVKFEGEFLTVNSIRNIESISSRLILVSGSGTVQS